MRGCLLLPEGSSDSVHARGRRLQAIDGEYRPASIARIDRPHRPATRCNPELLPVGRAAELVSRSPCRTRREGPTAPQAASAHGYGLRRQFADCGHGPAANVRGGEDFQGIYHTTLYKSERWSHNI